MKFEVHGKKLQEAIKKVEKTVGKYTNMLTLTVDDGDVFISSTNVDEYTEVYISSARGVEDGVCSFDYEDAKFLKTVNDYVMVYDDGDNLKFQCGFNKRLCFKKVAEDVEMPEFTKYTHFGSFDGAWLLETLTKLVLFINPSDARKPMDCFNFNSARSRVEALDGHRIAYRDFNSKVKLEDYSPLMIYASCILPMKVLLNKYDRDVSISYNKNYIRFYGAGFKYIQRRVEGDYFKIAPMLNDETKFTVDLKTAPINECVKMCADIVKSSKTPMIMEFTEDELVVSAKGKVSFNESFDVNGAMPLRIGFNPFYLLDVFKTADTDYLTYRFGNAKSPVLIDAIEYHYLVLPIKINA